MDRSSSTALFGTSFIEGLPEPVSNIVDGVETADLRGTYGVTRHTIAVVFLSMFLTVVSIFRR